jgi:hypothetical protein
MAHSGAPVGNPFREAYDQALPRRQRLTLNPMHLNLESYFILLASISANLADVGHGDVDGASAGENWSLLILWIPCWGVL